METVTVQKLESYLNDHHPTFDQEETSVFEVHQDWFNEAIDTVFADVVGTPSELATQWNEEESENYVSKSAWVSELFRERFDEEVITNIPEQERDLFIHIQVETIEESR